jgi:hypothetical protein
MQAGAAKDLNSGDVDTMVEVGYGRVVKSSNLTGKVDFYGGDQVLNDKGKDKVIDEVLEEVVEQFNQVVNNDGDPKKEDPTKPCNDCPSKEKFTHKNREVFSSTNGNDYIFYDNKWHWITKSDNVTIEYRDPTDASPRYRTNPFVWF